ncbi:hypothetical protein [Nocardia concava]|uniref:hypothetical protein n=1 Tax=Nocardia concava TaxID=257281 RepID=UPI0002F73AD3|nr:hypothetical protein [Nocardia concava]
MTDPAALVSTATSSNTARTITVTATDQGTITELRFDAGVYGHGAGALAAEIVRLAQRSTLLAKAHRREALAAAGLAPVLLDRLGLPAPEAVAAELARLDAPAAANAPRTWVRAV